MSMSRSKRLGQTPHGSHGGALYVRSDRSTFQKQTHFRSFVKYTWNQGKSV